MHLIISSSLIHLLILIAISNFFALHHHDVHTAVTQHKISKSDRQKIVCLQMNNDKVISKIASGSP